LHVHLTDRNGCHKPPDQLRPAPAEPGDGVDDLEVALLARVRFAIVCSWLPGEEEAG
jgi:hypothetical protein